MTCAIFLLILLIWLPSDGAKETHAAGSLLVRVGIELEDTCLDEEVRARLRHRNEALHLSTRDLHPACRRHSERCDPWLCHVTEADYYRWACPSDTVVARFLHE